MSILYKRHDLYPDSILIRDFQNKVNVDEIINSWESLKEDNLLSGKLLGVINNLSDCELNMNMESFRVLMTYLRNDKRFSHIKLAVICDKPSKVIFPILGEQEGTLKIKPFYTIDAAVEWIIY